MTDTEVSDEPRILSETKMGVSEGRVIVAQRTYTPPLDGSEDQFERVDNAIARDIYAILTKKYFGYEWKSYSDVKQGIVGFSIPRLMGPTAHFVINLRQFSDLSEQLITRFGGELLDRMGLPTDRFGMEAYMKAVFRKETFDFGKMQ